MNLILLLLVCIVIIITGLFMFHLIEIAIEIFNNYTKNVFIVEERFKYVIKIRLLIISFSISMFMLQRILKIMVSEVSILMMTGNVKQYYTSIETRNDYLADMVYDRNFFVYMYLCYYMKKKRRIKR